MGKQRVLGIAAAALLVFTAACDDSSTAPAALSLDSLEREFLATQADAVLAALVGDYLNSVGDAPVVASEGVALNGAASRPKHSTTG